MIRGRSAATAATADHTCAALWNPHASRAITVYEIGLVVAAAPVAGCTVAIRRISTRGTPGSTMTSTIASDTSYGVAPPSGAVLDLATYTVQPTVDGPGLWGWVLPAVTASGFIQPLPRGVTIRPGQGLAVVTGQAIAIPAAEVYVVWED